MAKTIAVDLQVNTESAQKSTQELTGSLDKLSGGAVSGFRAMKASLMTVVGGFRTLKGAIAATGIGALVLVIASLKAAFTSSEEGQNKFNKIMTVTGALVGNLVDILADLGEKIIEVFTNPVESIKNFGSAIVEFIKNPIEGVQNAYESATKAVSDFIGEQKKEINSAQEVSDMRAKADKIERDLLVERSVLESKIAELRLKSRQEDQFTADERRQALLDAQVLEDNLLKKETEYLELRRDAQVLENTFSRSNKENLDKEAQAIAAVNRQTAIRLNAQRQVQRELNRLNNELEREQDLLAKAKEENSVNRLQVRVEEEKEIGLAVNNQVLTNAENQIKIEQQAADKRSQIYEQDRINKEQNALNALNSILSINSIFEGKTENEQKKSFKRAKKLNIAAATVETYLAAQKAFTSQIIPLDPTSPIRGGLAAAAAVAAGLARVAQIKKQTFNGGVSGSSPISLGASGRSSGSGSGFNPDSPTISSIPNFANQAAIDNLNNQNGIRAYVVENDISSTQALNKRLREKATL